MKKQFVLVSILLIFLSGCFASESKTTTADAVIFSFDRPMQLFALLESMHKYIHGINELHVIYRASAPEYAQAYQTVFLNYPHVIAHPQGIDPKNDFKPLTLQATFNSPSEYVLFAVDDIVVKDTVNIDECIQAMNKHNAYGFFLRLGTHLTDCYPTSRKQPLPQLKKVAPTIVAWQFAQGNQDWAYPNTVDMTIYRKKDIASDVRKLPYQNPNSMEGNWSGVSRSAMHKTGLCYENSKIVNLPLNRVQSIFQNRAMNEFSPKDLLDLFNENKKIDLKPLAQIKNPSAHMEYSPTFIMR